MSKLPPEVIHTHTSMPGIMTTRRQSLESELRQSLLEQEKST
ncbi:hypothetical protein ACWKX9_24610 [Enterobacter asburiae]|nr:hypothetical protein [Enterobacter bugandensis]